jgi:enediyne biosynthesis protein E4
VDVVTVSLNAPPKLLVNRTANNNHWLIVRLVGAKSNRDGLGAKLKLTAGKTTQFNHATTSVGYSSASDRRVHFGLGAESKVTSLEIIWPSGAKQVLTGIRADQALVAPESEAK